MEFNMLKNATDEQIYGDSGAEPIPYKESPFCSIGSLWQNKQFVEKIKMEMITNTGIPRQIREKGYYITAYGLE